VSASVELELRRPTSPVSREQGMRRRGCGMRLAPPGAMTKARTAFPPLMLLIVFVCFATVAHADPMHVTSGVVQTGFAPVGQPLPGEGLQLTAGGLTLASSLEDPGAFLQLAAVPTVASGAVVDFSGALHTNGGIGGQENGSFVFASPFTMFFAAAPTTITCSTVDALTQCTGAAPFTMDATLALTAADGTTSTRHLIGSGTVEGSLFGGNGTTDSVSVHYTFDASQTPEPATLSLLTAGALVAGWRRRRGMELHLR
jgi:PEP-CTERM motif